MSRLEAIAKARAGALARLDNKGGGVVKAPALGRLAMKIQMVEELGPDAGQYSEIRRICGLPVKKPMTPEEIEEFNRSHLMGEAFRDGFRAWGVQCEGLRDFESEGGLFGPIGVGWGKCCSQGTELLDSSLGRMTIREAAELGGLTTPSMDESSGDIDWARATAFESGEKDCVRIVLKSGHETEPSLDHPIFTQRGWVLAGDLLDTDLVATARQAPEPPEPLVLPDVEVKALAYLLTDGGTSQNYVRFTSMPGVVVDEFRACVEEIGEGSTVNPTKGKAVNVYCRGMLPFTRGWGIQGCLSKNKRIPARIYLLGNRDLALFLNRFWATDGHVNNEERLVEITLASKAMIKDLQALLTRFGILARYRYKKAKCEGKTFDAWRLVVSGKSQVERFLTKIGDPLGSEWRCDLLRANTAGVKTNTNTDVVPVTRGDHVEIAASLGLPRMAVRKALGLTKGQWLGRDKFRRFVEETGYSGKLAWLASADLAWQKIKSLTETGRQKVYDLNVPGTPSWVADGIVVHNTMLTQWIASAAYRKGIKKMILLIPSQVLNQLVLSDFPFARKRIPINYPVHVLGGRPPKARRMLAKSGKKGLYIVPYSLLSQKDAVDNLNWIAPELIICDEADKLGNRKAARTKRLMEYVRDHNPQGVCVSGTITSKEIRDYWHLIKWCLGSGCPLPLSSNLASEWGAKIDAEAASSDATGPIVPLLQWASKQFPKETITEDTTGFRLAYKLRLRSTPGVVSTGDADIGPSLIINNLPVRNHEDVEGWERLDELITKVQESWLTPNDDEIEHAIHTYKWLYELSAGFYNQLTWPSAEDYAEREKVSLPDAVGILDQAEVSHGMGQVYSSALRSWIDTWGAPGLDTPMLVGLDMHNHKAMNVGTELFTLWREHKEAEEKLSGLLLSKGAHRGSTKELRKKVVRSLRDSAVVRVCDYKIAHAVEWAKGLAKGEGAILWVWHQGIGEWLVEALQVAGLRPLYCPAGPEHNVAILDPANRSRVIVASMGSHGTGKNLQAFHQQLFVQWPRNAKVAEQTLGRMHRNGQKSDEVWAHTISTLEFDQLCFAATLNDSLYIHQSTGNRQKLIYATYSELPKIFPSPVLRERGFQNRSLTLGQQEFMGERFGQL